MEMKSKMSTQGGHKLDIRGEFLFVKKLTASCILSCLRFTGMHRIDFCKMKYVRLSIAYL